MSVETNVFVLEKHFLTCGVPSIQVSWKKNPNAKSKTITTPKLKKSTLNNRRLASNELNTQLSANYSNKHS